MNLSVLVRTIAVASAVLAVMALNGCGRDDALIDDSTAVVLVPTDVRFLDTLKFDPLGAPNNYLVRSNWSAEFDPDVDRALTIESYQISDSEAWPGEHAFDDAASVAAFSTVVNDSATMAPGGPCEVTLAKPLVVSCTYRALDGEPFSILARRFDTTSGESLMLAFGGFAASHEFMAPLR